MKARDLIEREFAGRPRGITLVDGQKRPVQFDVDAIAAAVTGNTGIVQIPDDESLAILEMPEGQPGCTVMVDDDPVEFDDVDEGVRFFMSKVSERNG